MERHYSTLELVKHDETARAPERDLNATAFEVDASAVAPQCVPDTTPQVSYDSSFPEAHSQTEDSSKERALSHHITKVALKWPWMVVALIVAAAIAIGVGVGIWRHNEHSTSKSSTAISPSVSQNQNITSAAQDILNDTSLAAAILSNGDRQLFFQDNSRRIRRVVRGASNSRWSTSLYVDISQSQSSDYVNPKKYTPLAVTVDEGSSVSSNQIVLYFVTDDYHVSSAPHGPAETSFNPSLYAVRDLDLENCSTAADTRSLSVTLISGQSESSNISSIRNSALMYYETPTGKVSVLLQRTSHSTGSAWFNITSQTSQSLPDAFRNPAVSFQSRTLYRDESDTESLLTAPFTSRVNGNFSKSITGRTIAIGAVFHLPRYGLVPNEYDIGLSGYGNFSIDLSSSTTDMNKITTRHSDVAVIQPENFFWVNGTQPVMSLNSAPPESSFPFARLASATVSDLSTTYLYHQINGTTIAEELWDNSLNAWMATEYITVSES